MNKQQKINYSQLYYDKELVVFSPNHDKKMELSIELKDLNNIPDCQVGHFGYNFWFRTKAGIEKRKYTSRNKLEQAVWQCAIKNGFKPIKWIDKT